MPLNRGPEGWGVWRADVRLGAAAEEVSGGLGGEGLAGAWGGPAACCHATSSACAGTPDGARSGGRLGRDWDIEPAAWRAGQRGGAEGQVAKCAGRRRRAKCAAEAAHTNGLRWRQAAGGWRGGWARAAAAGLPPGLAGSSELAPQPILRNGLNSKRRAPAAQRRGCSLTAFAGLRGGPLRRPQPWLGPRRRRGASGAAQLCLRRAGQGRRVLEGRRSGRLAPLQASPPATLAVRDRATAKACGRDLGLRWAGRRLRPRRGRPATRLPSMPRASAAPAARRAARRE